MSSSEQEPSVIHSALSLPLLGVLPAKAEDLQRLQAASLPREREDDGVITCAHDCLWSCVMLPLLLLIQFGLSYYQSPSSSQPCKLPPVTWVLEAIVLFCLASALYKFTLSNYTSRTPSMMIMDYASLIPELWMNAVLVAVLLTNITIALQLLFIGTFTLSLVVAIFTIVDDEDEHDEDEHDEIDGRELRCSPSLSHPVTLV
jgi:hypothetical protein